MTMKFEMTGEIHDLILYTRIHTGDGEAWTACIASIISYKLKWNSYGWWSLIIWGVFGKALRRGHCCKIEIRSPSPAHSYLILQMVPHIDSQLRHMMRLTREITNTNVDDDIHRNDDTYCIYISDYQTWLWNLYWPRVWNGSEICVDCERGYNIYLLWFMLPAEYLIRLYDIIYREISCGWWSCCYLHSTHACRRLETQV